MAISLELITENLGSNEVVWTVLRDGVEIAPPFTLNAKGGHGFFSEPGLYTFIAIRDAIAKGFIYLNHIQNSDGGWGIEPECGGEEKESCTMMAPGQNIQ